MTITLRIGDTELLGAYVARQLQIFGEEEDMRNAIATLLPETLERFVPISRAVGIFKNDHFDHLHSLQYATFLYLMGRIAWERDSESDLVDKLFFLNKSICNIEIHPAVKLPPVFFISHGIGSVVGNAVYGNRLVIFQNVTIGRVGNNRPIIGNNVILYAGASVTGKSQIGNNVVISSGVRVHNKTVPDNSIVYSSVGDFTIIPMDKDYITLYLP